MMLVVAEVEVEAALPSGRCMICCMLCGGRRVSVVHDAVAVKESRLACLAVVFILSPFLHVYFAIAWLPARPCLKRPAGQTGVRRSVVVIVAASWGGGLCYTSGYERGRWRSPQAPIPCGRRRSSAEGLAGRQQID
jgi:hypothetical protein